MYWQTRFNRQPRNQKLEEKITELHKEHKDFGYRRMHGMLIKLGYHVNKKRVQRISFRYHHLHVKAENIARTKERLAR